MVKQENDRMDREPRVIGFLGSGGIARAHAMAVSSLKFYYGDTAPVRLRAVSSQTAASRESFAGKYGFEKAADPESFFADNAIDTVYILGPNNVHFAHLRASLGMPSVKRIYIEKPVCASADEENEIPALVGAHPGVAIQAGFQYLFSSSVREALRLWQTGVFGKALHFEFRYYHGDYLRKEYRDKRQTRLTPAPDGGAMADLGSHAISLLLAFLGNEIRAVSAIQSGSFDDVDRRSDLFSMLQLRDENSGAAGSLAASRIASGTGDLLSFEIYAEKGALKYSSHTADYFEYCLDDSSLWTRHTAGSSYPPVTSFPSGHVPPGWLRSMIHAHYVFLNDAAGEPFVPGIPHGLQVQRLIRETAALIERRQAR